MSGKELMFFLAQALGKDDEKGRSDCAERDYQLY